MTRIHAECTGACGRWTSRRDPDGEPECRVCAADLARTLAADAQADNRAAWLQHLTSGPTPAPWEVPHA